MSDAQRNERGQLAVSLASGAVFGVGLAVSGMTRPEKVRGFLDFLGRWDPSLAFVMGGAVLVHMAAFWLITKRRSPVFAARFGIPTRRDIDARLVLGAALFGIGWGLGGFCPGPGITSLVGGAPSVLVFVLAMVASLALTARIEAAR